MSAWGKGEELTLNALKNESIKGKWLDLGAGDGRYIKELLRKADLVIADIDKKEIKKAIKSLNKKQMSKIKVSIFDMTKKFPFSDESFDGVFCTGTLHLFKEDKLKIIFHEITRVLKPKGKLIIDFAYNVKRILPSGNEININNSEYSLVWNKSKVKNMLDKFLKNYDKTYEVSIFSDDLRENSKYGFITKGEFFLVVAIKNKSS